MQPGANLVTANATANGSGAAILLQTIVSWLATGTPFAVITKLKYKINLNANALNGISSHKILSFNVKREEKLFFVINNNKTFVDIQRNEPTINTIPWESVPGGTQSLGDRLNTSSNYMNGNWSMIAPWFLGFNYSVTLAPAWSFVPVTSALDIQNPSSQNGQYSFPINGQNGSTASRYIAQETTLGFSNVTHTNFTSRNARWLYNEIQGISQPTNECADVCASGLTISGPEEACNGTYSVTAIPGATYVWTVSPAGATYLSSNTNSISITTPRNSYGEYTVSVTVYTNQGSSQCVSGQGSKLIKIGLKAPYIAGPFDPVSHQEMVVGYPNINYYFEAHEYSSNYGPFTYTWTLTPPNNNPCLLYTSPSPRD